MSGKIRLELLSPPDRDTKVDLIVTALALGAAIIWSVGAPLDMHRAWNAVRRGCELGIRCDEPTFSGTIGASLYGFGAVALGMLVLAVRNYLSFRQGSRADYLMRRLSGGWELHLRCLAVPVMGIFASALLAAALYFIYRGYFFHCQDAARAYIKSIIGGAIYA